MTDIEPDPVMLQAALPLTYTAQAKGAGEQATTTWVKAPSDQLTLAPQVAPP